MSAGAVFQEALRALRRYGLPIPINNELGTLARFALQRAWTQWQEIDALNARFEGAFRIFKGIEANILVDIGLDDTVDGE